MSDQPPARAERAPATAWGDILLPLGLIAGLVLLLSLNVRTGAASVEPAEVATPLEAWLKTIVGYIAAGAEIAAAAVIGGAVLRAAVVYALRLVSRREGPGTASERIRLQLGRALALGLEFTIASDILRTAVAPTRQDILNLGAIVMLRTLLNFFLEREIRQGERDGLGESGVGRALDEG